MVAALRSDIELYREAAVPEDLPKEWVQKHKKILDSAEGYGWDYDESLSRLQNLTNALEVITFNTRLETIRPKHPRPTREPYGSRVAALIDTLDRLSVSLEKQASKTFTLEFNRAELKDLFDLSTLDFEDSGFWVDVPESEIDFAIGEQFGDDAFEHPEIDEIREAVGYAIRDAIYSGTEAAYIRAQDELLYDILDDFVDFGHVEYPCEGEQGTSYVSKGVQGIVGYNRFDHFGDDATTYIEFNVDTVDLINYLIACEGMFGIVCEEIEEQKSTQEYIKDHLHYLPVLYSCEGRGKPQMDTNGIDGYNADHFYDVMESIEKDYEL
jgi:hypothetical protein